MDKISRKKKSTKLSSVSKHITSFVDSTKKSIQHIHSTPLFKEGMKYKCFWCDLHIDKSPIGCPIKQIPTYSSKTIKLRNNENVTIQLAQQNNQNKFITDKVFCSFNCVQGFINHNSWNDYYMHSTRLLSLMYYLMTGEKIQINIAPAPCKSIMIDYGGDLTSEQYRNNFERILYIDSGNICMFPVSNLYEEVELI